MNKPKLAAALAAVAVAISANAHTNYPSFYIRYAQADQVNWANPNAAPWMLNYTADPLNIGSLNILVGTFINTGGTNSPPPTSEKMRSNDYVFYLSDVTQSNNFIVQQAIVATNGIWQGKPFSLKVVDKTMGGYGEFDNNQFSISIANAVTGDGLSSALQISLNPLQTQPGDTLTFEMGGASVTYADGSVHTYDTDPEFSQVTVLPSGSIQFLPEPSTTVLAVLGAAALACLRRQRKGWASNFSGQANCKCAQDS